MQANAEARRQEKINAGLPRERKTEALPGDVLTEAGNPFSSLGAAKRAAKKSARDWFLASVGGDKTKLKKIGKEYVGSFVIVELPEVQKGARKVKQFVVRDKNPEWLRAEVQRVAKTSDELFAELDYLTQTGGDPAEIVRLESEWQAASDVEALEAQQIAEGAVEAEQVYDEMAARAQQPVYSTEDTLRAAGLTDEQITAFDPAYAEQLAQGSVADIQAAGQAADGFQKADLLRRKQEAYQQRQEHREGVRAAAEGDEPLALPEPDSEVRPPNIDREPTFAEYTATDKARVGTELQYAGYKRIPEKQAKRLNKKHPGKAFKNKTTGNWYTAKIDEAAHKFFGTEQGHNMDSDQYQAYRFYQEWQEKAKRRTQEEEKADRTEYADAPDGADSAGLWPINDNGYLTTLSGAMVRFPSMKAAAIRAAKNRQAGNFELVSGAANTEYASCRPEIRKAYRSQGGKQEESREEESQQADGGPVVKRDDNIDDDQGPQNPPGPPPGPKPKSPIPDFQGSAGRPNQ